MTDSTKNLFDAPWTVYGEPDDYSFVIQKASEDEIATVFIPDDANRLARLPEMYDALMDAALGRCWACSGIGSDILESGCPKKNDVTCYVAKWLDLLKKVRDGE